MTDKRLRFAREYAVDMNGTQAAVRAGYAPGTANRTAYSLLRDPLVVAEVHKRIEKVCIKTDVTAARVLNDLVRIASADLTSIVRVVNGRVGIVDTDTLTMDQRSAIAEISQTADGVRVKLHDKTRVLELIGKYLGMFRDRLEVSGGSELAIVEKLTDANTTRNQPAASPDGVPPQ